MRRLAEAGGADAASSRRSGSAAAMAAAWSGKAAWQRNAFAPEAWASQATSSGTQPEIGRHPDRAEAEGGEHRFEDLVAVLGMHQDAVALADAARRQRRRQGGDPGIELRQFQDRSPQAKAGRSGKRRADLGEEADQVHHPAGNRQAAAGGGGAHASTGVWRRVILRSSRVGWWRGRGKSDLPGPCDMVYEAGDRGPVACIRCLAAQSSPGTPGGRRCAARSGAGISPGAWGKTPDGQP